jgi:hypothetical protein
MRRWAGGLAATALVILVGAGVFLSYYAKTLGPRLKRRVITALEDRFDADVQLNDLQISIFPMPSVTGEGLVINHKGWTNDQHPLLKIRRFRAATDFTTLLDWRNRVDSVTLEGLEIHIPPRGRSLMSGAMQGGGATGGNDQTHLKFIIKTIVADGTLLEIEPKSQGKEPMQFPIEKLTMHSVGVGEAMTFTARLKNAKPPGDIETAGHFGPWQKDDPRATHVSGDYTFTHADLSVFNGISGILSSTGKYGGELQHIAVEGTTDTPAFSLRTGGEPVHLTTSFHSVVDATNGDTTLDPVDAKFLHSEFICRGGVTQQEGQKGKTVSLDAYTKSARMEDILRLLVNGKPLLDGQMQFNSKIIIPPGKEQVLDKLGLDGQFVLSTATFTSEEAASRMRTLSDRASGISKSEEKKGEGAKQAVASNMRARFKLNKGVAAFSQISFEVPGARLQLAGNYNLKSSDVDFKGNFRMQAKLSQTQSGFKHVMLMPLDRFFEKDGAGFEVPVSITGTKEKPTIGVSAFHRTFTIH